MAAVASVGAGATGTAGYVWEDPGDSIMVQVSLDLVERLGAAVQQGLGAGPRGNEIGGILLGRTLPGLGRAVLIEDFEPAPCEHLRGASYTLSPKDKRLLGTRLARRAPRQVVGYFRSHTRPGMYLDQDDFAVFSRYFPEAWQVFLLVRPSTEGPAMGGFFFWEDGDINRRSTYRQFPFDGARLATGDFPITGGQSAAAPAAPRPVPVLVPKPEAPARRRLPPLPWIVVPVIAVLFLIAGFFVSENQTPARETAAAKTSASVEPLLPEPVPPAAVSPPAAASTPTPPPAQEAAAPQPEPIPQASAAEPKPTATPKPKPAKRPLRKVAAPPPVTVARMPSREVEPPPVLAAPIEGIASKLPAVLPSRVAAAPPPEAEVSYEAPHPGVFRRALHKISGTGEAESGAFVPPSPVRKVAPVKPADAGAEARPVDVKVFIDESGNVSRVQVLTKGSDLAAAALSAARQWQFTPARKHDKAVPSEMLLHFR
jgi:TonB family protein